MPLNKIAAHEPPPPVSSPGEPFFRTLAPLPAPVPGGGR